MTRRQQQWQRTKRRQSGNELSLDTSAEDANESENNGEEPKRAVINVNESIVSLLLRLHSKYSNRPDSYVPKKQRIGSFSASDDYVSSRIGDGAFFVEKVLDQICDIDETCAESVHSSR